MLGFFPMPYPDELFYGTLARLHKILGTPADGTFSKFLYGKGRGGSGILVDKKTKLLMGRLPSEHPLTAERIKKDHSLEPLLSAFDETKRQVWMERNPDRLYSCQTCRDEDSDRIGEAYWHRSHQIPNGRICHLHKTPLQESIKKCYLVHAEHRRCVYFCPADTQWKHLSAPSAKEQPVYERFHARVQTILKGQGGLSSHRHKLLEAATQAGFTNGRRLKQKASLRRPTRKLEA